MAIDCVSNHHVYICDRGGVTRLAELVQLTEVSWQRVRDDISEANVRLYGAACQAQADVLATIEPGRHEIVIYRGDQRVWEGPVTRLTYTRDGVEIHASDVMYYLNRLVMTKAYSNAYPNTAYVIDRVKNIINGELPRKEALTPPVNVLPFIVYHQKSTDAKTTASTVKYQYTVWEHIDSLAAKSGIDYTVIGRAIHFWDTHESLGLTPVVTEDDFLGDLTVSVYGSELATKAYVTDGQGRAGVAGGTNSFYGLWETLATAYDESQGGPPPTQAELNSQASRNLTGRIPTPLQVRIPDNSSLNPNGVLSVTDLVPGIYIPLRADITIRTIQQTQKLTKVEFTETADGEEIQVVLYPAANDDVVEEEEG